MNLCADIFTGLEAHHDELAWRYTKPFGMSCSFPRPFRCCRHNLSSCQTSSAETPNQKRHVMSGQCDAPNKKNPSRGSVARVVGQVEPSLLNRPLALDPEAHRNAIQRTNFAAYRSYRRVNTPNKNPSPTAIAMAVSGFRVMAASTSCAASVALTCARPICLLAMRPTLEVRF